MTTPFNERWSGRFDGMIRLQDVAQLGDEVAARDGWYLMEPDGDLPKTPVDGHMARQHLDTLVAEILEEEKGVWTTMVYVQSQEDPWVIKVFHPRRAGCGCGGGGGILPWWIISRVMPDPVLAWKKPTCATPGEKKGGWLKNLLQTG
ncbi:MAG: hypothetical protein HQL52_14170 [Magnetococcales bacterium]|nr:hypothetical protein [Magnetococcales bacterium]